MSARIGPLAIVAGALVFVALFALLGWGVWRSSDGDREALPSTLIGKPAPRLDLPLLGEAEKRLKTSDLRGAPFVLNVWGSWCVECRVEQPALLDWAKSQRIALIGYNLKDEPDDAMQWLKQNGNPYRVIAADIDGHAALDWGIYGAPETFLVDADGIVRWKHVGPLNGIIIQKELLPRLERLP